MRVLKWFDTPYFEYNLILDNKLYLFGAKWNIRDESWYIDLYDNEDNAIFVGKRLVLNFDLLNGNLKSNRPEGYMIAISTANNSNIITRNNMNSEIDLLYIKSNEIL